MDRQSVISTVDSWPVQDRIDLLHHLRDGLAAEGGRLSEEQRAEIDQMLAEDDADPDDVIPWEIVKADALARLRP